MLFIEIIVCYIKKTLIFRHTQPIILSFRVKISADYPLFLNFRVRIRARFKSRIGKLIRVMAFIYLYNGRGVCVWRG